MSSLALQMDSAYSFSGIATMMCDPQFKLVFIDISCAVWFNHICKFGVMKMPRVL